jgi:hypothetical protein
VQSWLVRIEIELLPESGAQNRNSLSVTGPIIDRADQDTSDPKPKGLFLQLEENDHTRSSLGTKNYSLARMRSTQPLLLGRKFREVWRGDVFANMELQLD